MSYTRKAKDVYLATNNTEYYGWVGKYVLGSDGFYPTRLDNLDTEITTKICSKCGVIKSVSEYYKAKDEKGGVSGTCKVCHGDIMRTYHSQNKDENAKRHRAWRSKNKRKLNDAMNAHYKKRYKQDPVFKLKATIRARIRGSIKGRSVSSQKLLGCTGEQAYQYLVSLFTEGMTEEAFLNGEIHIDHIRPVASFDLTDPQQKKECFHYTNLQPLWAKDNLKKGSKWDDRQNNA